ncbi:ABC transporter ATP-binding protein [Rhodospirillaceae bacterium KN72]|uniref:Spermidine/putrescine import ATP-binding protein PotA n=1 Tax=Pacificispira spongiicola TaxID=2729598 RepID=A0A7Y0DXA0_9PROT|nr:ABC transporter ATP-binding protein [Pacificispira spongiicola]NMM43304.1 ABC transporter ATP-binding protein [Pacificispira spongiicola]
MSEAAGISVELKDVVKRYGAFTAVHNTNLDIEDGSFLTLLGPSGCGKTTTLRMIAGLTSITEGDVLIKGRRVNDLPIHKRNLGIVFQNYALFPHKSVFDNVAFGLKYRNVAKADAAKRVKDALELVQLPQMADRMPSQLSGGQQQRIALARAIVIQPDVLLLDEPLSALDANLREDMRIELKKIQHTLGVTTVFVTHDQSEALAMSDKIVVMSAGHVEQVGTPEEVYNSPASEFVAGFLGNSNILDATVSDAAEGRAKLDVDGLGTILADTGGRALSKGGKVKVSIRAEKLYLDADGEDDSSSFSADVGTVDYQGQVARYFLTVGDRQLQAINPIDDHPIAEGKTVAVKIRARDCVVLPA